LTVAGPPAVRPRGAGRPRKVPLGTIAALLATIPFLLLLSDLLRGTLGVDPVDAGIRRTGWWALTLLVATLAVTPVRRITRWNRLIDIRKPLGIAAFAYATLHLIGYVAIEQWFGWSYILEDILERPFITAGFTAFLLLVPLAATSTRNSIRRLGGRRWQRLHRLIYPASLLGVLHYYWLVKADTRPPLTYGAIVVVLLALRVWNPLERKAPPRSAPPVEAPRPRTAAGGMD
jgi:sulfoxide reductase heme-binding subunit YedZ